MPPRQLVNIQRDGTGRAAVGQRRPDAIQQHGIGHLGRVTGRVRRTGALDAVALLPLGRRHRAVAQRLATPFARLTAGLVRRGHCGRPSRLAGVAPARVLDDPVFGCSIAVVVLTKAVPPQS